MSLLDCTIRDFNDRLASGSAIPGGGGAAALAAALGAALGMMVGNLTAGKKKYAAVEDEIIALMDETEKLRHELLSEIDGDAAAFEPLSKAYALPPEYPGRDEIMENCLRDAAKAPLRVMRLVCRVIELQRSFAEKGSVMAVSDAGSGVVFCWAALYASALNVRINTKPMKDREFAEDLNAKASAYMEKYWKIAEEVYEGVYRRLE